MNIRDGTDKRVSFNTRDELGDKIDKLTVMMSKLVAKDSHERNLLNPRFTRTEDEIDLMITEHIRPDQMIETEDMM